MNTQASRLGLSPLHRMPAMVRHSICLAVACLLGACATTPRAPEPTSLPSDGRVEVSWTDPAAFIEPSCRFTVEGRDTGWVRSLAQSTRDRAERLLPAGERLDIRFLVIDRAGECEPLPRSGGIIRVVREIYPPRITVHYRRTAADGRVLDEADRRLSNNGFLMDAGRLNDNDPLRHERGMIDGWLRALLGTRR